MLKDIKRYGQASTTSVVAQRPARMDGFVNIGPALVCSHVTSESLDFSRKEDKC